MGNKSNPFLLSSIYRALAGEHRSADTIGPGPARLAPVLFGALII
jgi:hypothetical protein